MALALWVTIGLWPSFQPLAAPEGISGMLAAASREALTGTALGLAMALPFQVLHAFGAIVDNQRGANIGSSLDPVSGVDATETASLLQMLGLAMFLSMGGMTELLEALRMSYEVIGMDGDVRVSPWQLASYIGVVLATALRMAAPVVCALFLVEMLLGVLSRFAQQMNAFSVALAAKSVVAFAIMLIYVIGSVSDALIATWKAQSPLRLLELTPL